MRKDFVAFILSHGRADKVKTWNTLKNCGYSGKVVIVLDDQDEQAEIYKKKYGKDNVFVFNKEEQYTKTDTMDNFHKMGVILYARNACFEIAKKLGYEKFIELDDDYTAFQFRYIEGEKLKVKKIKKLDAVFESLCEFLDVSGSLTVALSQGGDFVGGAKGRNAKKKILRKAMNSFVCNTKRKVDFLGSINEDVNRYVLAGIQGELVFSTTQVALVQTQMQKTKGGMTEIYKDNGTFVKSFYSVMVAPSCVKIGAMGGGGKGVRNMRLHHEVDWDCCAAKILREDV